MIKFLNVDIYIPFYYIYMHIKKNDTNGELLHISCKLHPRKMISSIH